jgi:hypothetical protein
MDHSPTSGGAVNPVSVTWRWVRPLAYPEPGVLEINGVEYAVRPLQGGYRLTKPGGKSYDIDTSGKLWACDCPDAVFRERQCKHIQGLFAALLLGEGAE